MANFCLKIGIYGNTVAPPSREAGTFVALPPLPEAIQRDGAEEAHHLMWQATIAILLLFAAGPQPNSADVSRAEAVFARLMTAVADMEPRLRAARLPEFGSQPAFTVAENIGASKFASYAWETHVLVTHGVLELHNDDELAFLLGHELGHVYQRRMACAGRDPCGGLPVEQLGLIFDPNWEHDADAWGFLLGALAGYDPYAAGAFLGKSAFATGTASLPYQQYLESHPSFAYQSLNTRLTKLYVFAHRACREPETLPGRLLQLNCAERRESQRPSLTWLPL